MRISVIALPDYVNYVQIWDFLCTQNQGHTSNAGKGGIKLMK